MSTRRYQPGELVPGTIYRILRHLATGGMGSVYDVEDTTIGKRYVMKTLHPNLFSRRDLARRMALEARTLGRLSHPNIVEVVTAGQTADAQALPFYVMERLNGQNLRTVIEKKGALPAESALPIAIELLDALDHAHEHQVVHRDVKPENVFLHRGLTGTTVTKLLDFGIMRMLDESRSSESAGSFVGTMRYAAPEQLVGGTVGAATDLYAAGLVVYELLAGRGPFDQFEDAERIGYAHLREAPPPLSRFAAVEPAVEQIIMAALSKAPAARPRDAFTFAAQLRGALRVSFHDSSATDVMVLSQAPDNATPVRKRSRAQSPSLAFAPTDAAEVEPPTREVLLTEVSPPSLQPAETIHDPPSWAERAQAVAPSLAAPSSSDRGAATRSQVHVLARLQSTDTEPLERSPLGGPSETTPYFHVGEAEPASPHAHAAESASPRSHAGVGPSAPCFKARVEPAGSVSRAGPVQGATLAASTTAGSEVVLGPPTARSRGRMLGALGGLMLVLGVVVLGTVRFIGRSSSSVPPPAPITVTVQEPKSPRGPPVALEVSAPGPSVKAEPPPAQAAPRGGPRLSRPAPRGVPGSAPGLAPDASPLAGPSSLPAASVPSVPAKPAPAAPQVESGL